MTYIENPKTKGSGIICCIPQTGICPIGCADCFFQSGRSYLEPLADNLPNMPSLGDAAGKVVRVNDGNDSNNNIETVLKMTEKYPMKFYNTSIAMLTGFPDPVVLTVNPAELTDTDFRAVKKQFTNNLMFVRIRVNTWNLQAVVDPAINYYSELKIPIVLTFMAYHNIEDIPENHRHNYIFRKRTTNSYYAITTLAWETIMGLYGPKYVYSCGRAEGERGVSGCKYCGNCLREYFNCVEKMKQ